MKPPPSIETSSGFLVCSVLPTAKSWNEARSCTKDTRRSLRWKLSSCAGERRYSSNNDRSALKPLVLMLATLLATTSICRSSTICRDSPTRSAFSIGGSPLHRFRRAALPSGPADLSNRPGSPKPVVRQHLSESRASLENDGFLRG